MDIPYRKPDIVLSRQQEQEYFHKQVKHYESAIKALEQQLIEAEALLFRSQLLLDGQDYSEKLFVEINDYYKQYILPTHKK